MLQLLHQINQPFSAARTHVLLEEFPHPPSRKFVLLFLLLSRLFMRNKLYETQHFGYELLLFGRCSPWGAAASLR